MSFFDNYRIIPTPKNYQFKVGDIILPYVHNKYGDKDMRNFYYYKLIKKLRKNIFDFQELYYLGYRLIPKQNNTAIIDVSAMKRNLNFLILPYYKNKETLKYQCALDFIN